MGTYLYLEKENGEMELYSEFTSLQDAIEDFRGRFPGERIVKWGRCQGKRVISEDKLPS